MRKLGIAILVGAIAAACAPAKGAPASVGSAPVPTTAAPQPAVAAATPATTRAPSGTPRPSAKADPLPDAFIGAWYHPSPAYWW